MEAARNDAPEAAQHMLDEACAQWASTAEGESQ